MRRRWLVLALLLAGGARAEAQGRVVPEPAAPRRKARVVPAPRPVPPPRAQKRPRTAGKMPPTPAPSRVSPRRTVQPPAAAPSRAPVAPPPTAPAPGSEITATLMTFGIGEAVWERFGHNALWIHDAASGTDVAYNWGLFDFEQPGFFRRFLTGDTKYWMGGEDAYSMVAAYQSAGRRVTLQKLNLSPAQARALRDFVENNAREENKYYRYDYFRDNCSTRLRDAVDRAVGGALRRATDTMHTALSYRSESLRLTEGDIPVQAGIDVALGRPADAPLSAWESFFIPMRLRDGVRIVSIPGENGELVPLVAEERLLAPSQPGRVVEARTVPDHTRRNLVVGLVLAAVLAILRLLMRSHRWAAWLVALVGLVWSLLCGALGVILLLAWLATKHVFWAQNENLLLLSPVSLALVVLVPAAVLAGRAVRRARVLATVVAVMGLVALALSLAGGGQPIREVVALFLPMHLALALVFFLEMPRRVKATPAPAG